MYGGAATDLKGAQEWANWHTETLEVRSKGGSFVRADTQFRDQITVDSGSGFKAEKGRHHLKGLEDVISILLVSHESINPTRIVPRGSEMTLNQPQDRDRL